MEGESAATLDTGVKPFARSIAGAILGTAMGLAWPSGANGALITQIDASDGQAGGQPVYEDSGLTQGDSFARTWGGVDGLGADGMVFIDSLTSTDANISITLNNASVSKAPTAI